MLYQHYINNAELDRRVMFGGENVTLEKILKDDKEYFNKLPTSLLSVGSDTKTVKSEKIEVKTGIMYLAQADMLTKKTLCAFSELAGCKNDCLIHAGRLGMKHATRAIIRRTLLYLYQREMFDSMLKNEIMKLSFEHGDKLAIRLNGTSDIDFDYIIKEFKNVQFYDYTKILPRVSNNKLKNYDLTYSFSPYSKKSLQHGREAVKQKFKIAVAFNTKNSKGDTLKIPLKLFGKKIVSFDDTDARFLDKESSIGYLTRKGSSVKVRQADNKIKDSFFITEANLKELQV